MTKVRRVHELEAHFQRTAPARTGRDAWIAAMPDNDLDLCCKLIEVGGVDGLTPDEIERLEAVAETAPAGIWEVTA